MRAYFQAAYAHRKLIWLTFELFWISVYLLEVATRSAGADTVQFVYANF